MCTSCVGMKKGYIRYMCTCLGKPNEYGALDVFKVWGGEKPDFKKGKREYRQMVTYTDKVDIF